MPNHYHLIAISKEDDAIPKTMQKIATGYSRAINKAYQKSGHLFEGVYKAKLIPNNQYLLHLSRYIHLNPLNANLVNNLEDWQFSSYLDYIGKKHNPFLKTDIILDQFDFPINQVPQRNLVYSEMLAKISGKVLAIDFSERMIERAKEKIKFGNVEFKTADITNKWDVPDDSTELITCNLILEHIENLNFIFAEASRSLVTGGNLFVSELHPFRQYAGKKANFEREG